MVVSENPFLDPRETAIVSALVEVKSKRMPEDEALREALQQRYLDDSWSLPYIEDVYQTAQLLCDRED